MHLNLLVFDRNIFGSSSIVFGNPRLSAVIFEKCSETFVGKRSEIFEKWSEIFGKSPLFREKRSLKIDRSVKMS